MNKLLFAAFFVVSVNAQAMDLSIERDSWNCCQKEFWKGPFNWKQSLVGTVAIAIPVSVSLVFLAAAGKLSGTTDILDVATLPATNATSSTAMLQGSIRNFLHVNDRSNAAFYFEYGPQSNPRQFRAPAQASPLNENGFASQLVYNLHYDIAYRFRLVSVNARGVSYAGDWQPFQTLEMPSLGSVHVAEATITSTSAQFTSTINPQGSTTLKYYFECRTLGSPNWVKCTSEQQVNSGQLQAVEGTTDVSLSPGYEYFVRLAAIEAEQQPANHNQFSPYTSLSTKFKTKPSSNVK